MAEENPELKVEGSFDNKELVENVKKTQKEFKKLGDDVKKTSKASSKNIEDFSHKADGAISVLTESMLAYAATGSKVSAALTGIGVALEEAVLGRFQMVLFASTAAIKGINRLTDRFRALSIGASADIEALTTEFAPLLGSISEAKTRLRSLEDFAIGTPFELGDLINANKTLETLTRGAMSSKEGMTTVGDAAAVAGVSFAEMSRTIGRLYDALQSGRPAGVSAMRMQELGLLSGVARSQIESLTAAGKSGSEIWKVVATELERTSGAMEDMSNNLVTLESNLMDAQEKMKSAFGQGFLDAEKESVKAMTNLFEAMTPGVEQLGKDLSGIPTFIEKAKASVINFGAKFLGINGLIENSVLLLSSSMYALSAGSIAGVIASLLKLKKKSTGGFAAAGMAAKALTGGPMKQIGTSLKGLIEGFKGGGIMGAIAGWKDSMKGFGAATVQAFGASSKASGSQTKKGKALHVALTVLRTAYDNLVPVVKAVGKGIKAFIVGSLKAVTTGVGGVVAGVTLLTGVLLTLRARAVAARKAMEEINKASDKAVKKLAKQASEITSVADATAYYREQVNQLRQARERLTKAEAKGHKGQIKAAKEGLASIRRIVESQRKNPIDVTALRKTDDEKARKLEEQAMIRSLERQERAFKRTFLTPKQQLHDLRSETKEWGRAVEKATMNMENAENFRRESQVVGAERDVIKDQMSAKAEELMKLNKEYDKLANRLANMRSDARADFGGTPKAELDDIKKQMAEVNARKAITKNEFKAKQDEFNALPTEKEIAIRFKSDIVDADRQVNNINKLVRAAQGELNKAIEDEDENAEKQARERLKSLVRKANKYEANAASAKAKATEDRNLGMQAHADLKKETRMKERQIKLEKEHEKAITKRLERLGTKKGIEAQLINFDEDIKALKRLKETDPARSGVADERIKQLQIERAYAEKTANKLLETARAEFRIRSLIAEATINSLSGQERLANANLKSAERLAKIRDKIDERARKDIIDKVKATVPAKQQEGEIKSRLDTFDKENQAKQQEAMRSAAAEFKSIAARRQELLGNHKVADRLREEADAMRDQIEMQQRLFDLTVNQQLKPEVAQRLVDAEQQQRTSERARERNNKNMEARGRLLAVTDDLTRIGGARNVSGPLTIDPMVAQQEKSNSIQERMLTELEKANKTNNKSPLTLKE